jgi:hypothetical protein
MKRRISEIDAQPVLPDLLLGPCVFSNWTLLRL